jgi:hypothetical protein
MSERINLERIKEETAKIRFNNGMPVYMFPAHLQFGEGGFQPKQISKDQGNWGEVVITYRRLHGGFGLKFYKPTNQKVNSKVGRLQIA